MPAITAIKQRAPAYVQQLDRVFNYLDKNPTQNMFGREMVGDVLPHIVIARTKDELIDTSVIQLTNTLLPISAGYTMNRVYDRLLTLPKRALSPAKQWRALGKSLSLYSFLLSIPISNAFIRNWVTAKRTQTTGFIDMVGERNKQRNAEGVFEKLRGYERNIWSILGTGAAVSLGVLALAQIPVQRKWAFGPIARTVSKYLGLPGGNFENFARPAKSLFGSVALPPILMWGLPIYAGLFSASRDQFEFKELVLRFATFITSFFILPRIAKDAMMKHTPKVLKRVMGSARNAAIVSELVTTSVMFAILPPLVNIYLTRQRAKK
jgi:hypothetical protein